MAGNPGFRARLRRSDDVKSLRRARAGLVGAVVLAIAIVATGLPTGMIGRQRDALAVVDRQLATIAAHNAVDPIGDLEPAAALDDRGDRP